jgi:hypothetical protein
MSNLKWQLGGALNSGLSAIYVLDIVTTNGGAQMFTATEWPNEDGSNFTQGDADAVGAELKTLVDGLADVTSSTLTTLAVTGETGLIQGDFALEFDSGDYAAWTFALTLSPGDGAGFTNAYLVSSSPADGKLSFGDLSTVSSSLETYFLGLTDVTGCVTTKHAVTPGTV